MNKKDEHLPSSKEIAERILFRIYQCDNLVHRTATKALESFNISSHQWLILGSLAHPNVKNGMKVGDLANLLCVSRQSLTVTLLRLQKRELVERILCPEDARARKIQLTAAGAELWESLDKTVNEYYIHALDGFSFDDQVAILHHINKLLSSLSKL